MCWTIMNISCQFHDSFQENGNLFIVHLYIVRLVSRKTVGGDIERGFDNLSGSHHQSQVKNNL